MEKEDLREILKEEFNLFKVLCQIQNTTQWVKKLKLLEEFNYFLKISK